MYNSICRSYNELHGGEQLRKLAVIKGLLQISKDDLVLDVGCGTGLSCVLGCKIVGVDSSKAMVEESRKHFDSFLGCAENLPFDSKSFDNIICVTAIHNFSNIKKALKEISRVCRKKAAITLLKKSKKAQYIEKEIRSLFNVEQVVDDNVDLIMICSIR